VVDALGACLIAAKLGNKGIARRLWQQELRQELAQAFVGQRRPRDESLALLP
jgi:hypothetical protein